MTQTQLLALDTILPTVLCIVGLVFLAAAIWPIAVPDRAYLVRSIVFGVVGAACVGIGVWLWLVVLQTASKLIVQELPPPGATTSITTAQRASPPASSAPASSPAPAIISASPSVAPTSTPAASPTAAPTALPATPTIPPNLTPVAAIPFQPESTQAHAAIIGVEPFERGSMLYRDDLKQIYVLTLDNKFKVYPDTWVEGRDPDLGSTTPEGVKFRPRRGFGWLWASNPDIRQALGMGLTAEAGFTGSISGDGNATTIRADVTYVFNKDSTWALK